MKDKTTKRKGPQTALVAVGAALVAVALMGIGEYGEDSDPPQTEITAGPNNGDTITTTTATFAFTSSEANSTFACRVDNAAFAPCVSPHTTGALSAGKHDFEVQATDAAQNTDQSPAKRNFTVAPLPTTCGGATVTIFGTDKGDTLAGTPGNDVILALGGRDEISALGGDDLICAGKDADAARGGAGNDTIRGQSGDDVLSGRGGDDALLGAAGSDRCRGGPGTDRARGCERTVGVP